MCRCVYTCIYYAEFNLTFMGLVHANPKGFGTVLENLHILFYEFTLNRVLNTH